MLPTLVVGACEKCGRVVKFPEHGVHLCINCATGFRVTEAKLLHVEERCLLCSRPRIKYHRYCIEHSAIHDHLEEEETAKGRIVKKK